ncbi:MAG TPA: hypothetical protein VEW93_13975 [Acidimicrobiales bacterium]|nr:hypothetical protein [Acidimicrobiales bacterium]
MVSGREGTRFDWDSIEAEWEERDDRTFGLSVDAALGDLSGLGLPSGRLTALVDDAWKAAVNDRDGEVDVPSFGAILRGADRADPSGTTTALTAAWIYFWLLVRWENSDEYPLLRAFTTAATDALHTDGHHPSDAERVLRALDLLYDTLLIQLDAENAMFCGSAGLMAREAAAVAAPVAAAHAALEPLVAREPPLDEPPSDLAALSGILLSDTEALTVHYPAVAAAAEASGAWRRTVRGRLHGGSPPPADRDALAAAVATCRHAAAALDEIDVVLASEQRAHAHALADLLDVAEAPLLHVVEGEVVFVYPFGLPGCDPHDLEELVARFPLAEVAGLAVRTQELRLSDSWWDQEATTSRSRVHHVTRLALVGGVDLATAAGTDDEEVWEGIDVELCISSVGNHGVRVVIPTGAGRRRPDGATTTDPWTPFELDQLIRRAGHQCGRERIATAVPPRPGGAPHHDGIGWTWFAHLASDLIRGFTIEASSLLRDHGRAGAEEVRAACGHNDLRAGRHVVVRVDRAIAVDADGGRHEVDRLAPPVVPGGAVVGTAVLHLPQRRHATSLDEWVRYEAPAPEDLLGALALPGDRLTCAGDVTVLWLPDLPNWAVLSYQEVAEFNARLGGVYHSWAAWVEDAVHRTTEDVSAHQARVAGDPDGPDAVLAGNSAGAQVTLDELIAFGTEIVEQIVVVRSMLRHFSSPRLLRTRAERDLLDRLMVASGIVEVGELIDRSLNLLVDQQARVTQLTERRMHRLRELEAESARHRTWWVELFISVIGIVGLAGLFEFFNNEVVDQAGTLTGVAIGAAELVLLIAVVIAVVRWRWADRPEPAR